MQAGRQFALGLGQAVVHPGPLAAGFDQAGGAQDRQVPGDFEVGDIEGARQVADAGFPPDGEQGDEPQSGLLAQDFEQLCFTFHAPHSFYVSAQIRRY